MAVRKILARKKARELLAEAKVKLPPVPVEQLAIFKGADVHYEPFSGELSGMVHRQSSGKHLIGVNALHSATRQRFTIAHELGHLILHQNEQFHVDENSPIGFRTPLSSQATDSDEIEANQFAAELLMPVYLLNAEIAKIPANTGTEDAVEMLAKVFGVSEQAMTFRLSGLGVLA
jgi:Zn-dependent peptidase ImmA (M78 family)